MIASYKEQHVAVGRARSLARRSLLLLVAPVAVLALAWAAQAFLGSSDPVPTGVQRLVASPAPALSHSGDGSTCSTRDLKASVGDQVSEATGQHTVVLVLIERAARACTLRGYPFIEVVGARGEMLPFRLRHGSDMMLRSAVPATVTLSQGGRAYVVINKYRCDVAVRGTAARLRITPPGNSVPVRIVLSGTGPAVDWCGPGDPGSTITVSPIVASPHAALR